MRYRTDCDAIATQKRSNCTSIAHRLRIDLRRFGSYRAVVVQRFKGDVAAIA
jgi:hypothetical protein